LKLGGFYIIGSAAKKPATSAAIFADGSADESYDSERDLELSHWIPNRTPTRYKADTSTEICMNFAAESPQGAWDLALNNHVDVDGILSVFTLVHSDFALDHRAAIVQAAEMGDFWGWGERRAQILFQGLTLFMNGLQQEKRDVQEIYHLSFDRVRLLILGDHDRDPAIQDGLRALEASLERLADRRIQRLEHHSRLVQYCVPASMAENHWREILAVPHFNAPFGDGNFLWPQARNRIDKERIQLLSIETGHGWYHDLWYPGYMWADTPRSWRAPGLKFSGSTNGYYYAHEAVVRAVEQLQECEQGKGRWILADEVTPFSTIKGRNFPVVLSCMNDQGEPEESSVSPDRVAFVLGPAFKVSL